MLRARAEITVVPDGERKLKSGGVAEPRCYLVVTAISATPSGDGLQPRNGAVVSAWSLRARVMKTTLPDGERNPSNAVRARRPRLTRFCFGSNRPAVRTSNRRRRAPLRAVSLAIRHSNSFCAGPKPIFWSLPPTSMPGARGVSSVSQNALKAREAWPTAVRPDGSWSPSVGPSPRRCVRRVGVLRSSPSVTGVLRSGSSGRARWGAVGTVCA